MRLKVLRYSSQSDDTLGLLLDETDGRRFLCYTIEDEDRAQKMRGETRIPAGTYDITLRETGGFHRRYSDKFPDFHRGMLWIRDVPNFEWVLIHIGNTDDDTAGCLLLGDQSETNVDRDGEGRIIRSTAAYRRVYPQIVGKLLAGGRVTITYVDYA